MDLPMRVLEVNQVSASIITTETTTVTRTSPVMVRLPNKRKGLMVETTLVKLLGLEPQMS